MEMGNRHVALLIETSREYGRGLLRGIIKYQNEHGFWSVYFKPHGLGDPPPSWLRTWRGDGILARVNDRRMAKAVLQTGIPTVDLRGAVGDVGLPMIGMDNHKVVRLAAEHFLERGFRHFAFCGTPRGENRNQDMRADEYQRLLAERGLDCATYFKPPGRAPIAWEEEQDQMARWLKRLPKPIAVMTCHDDRGLQVLDACHRVGLAVPDQVAILGIDNDPFLCNLSTPPLSSIDVNPDRIGYEAAAVLDRLMQGAAPPQGPCFFSPRGVVTRRSTDVTAVGDPELARAISLIRNRACTPTSIGRLLREVTMSRTSFFRGIKKHLGRSPKEEMTWVRMQRAKDLLRTTDLPVSEVAGRVGYAEAKYFIEVFHRLEGVTPLRYRRKMKADDRS
jgi:LacI family transcriptional regulator